MPSTISRDRRSLVLRVPVAARSAGMNDVISMPRARSLCGGSIVAVPHGWISPDHRLATWTAPPDQPAMVELRWDLGSAGCPPDAYEGLPPYFIEGDPQTVEAIERLGEPR
jgi:hypothetical protein